MDILLKNFWFLVGVQSSYDLRCRVVDTKHWEFWKKLRFSKKNQDLFAVSIQNQEDIVESDNNMWKKTDNHEKLFEKINFFRFL